MEIEFDPEKREDILFRRGLGLATAGELLTGKCFTDAVTASIMVRIDGYRCGDVVACVWTDRGDEVVRIITMWKATAREQERYFRWLEGA